MRVIGQNSYLDMPYENTAISLGRNGTETEYYIYAHFLGDTNKSHTILATYYTEQKALKAMEMLRNAYTGEPFVVEKPHKLTDEEIKEIAKGNVVSTFDYSNYSRVVSGNNNVVFQFPKDSEVEV